MTGNLLVIISSGAEAQDKALTGLSYAINSKKNGWLENVALIFFGPSENMLAKVSSDSPLGKMLKQAIELGLTPMACKAISDGQGITTELKGLGVDVEYIGAIISSYIKKDYQVLTF